MNFSFQLTYIKIRGDDMYPNPYLMSTASRTGLLTRGLNAIKAVNWSTLLDGTQKTLGVINQAIPVVYQIKPIVNNARTLFRIAGSLNDNTPQEQTQPVENTTATSTPPSPNNSPIFYI